MKLKPVLTVAAFLFAGTLFAQTHYAERPIVALKNHNHLLLSPFYFFDGTFMLSYERLFRSGSLRITPSITLQNLNDRHYDNREGWGVDAGYKFFLTSRPYRVNFYMGPYALYKSINIKMPVEVAPGYYGASGYYTDHYDALGFGVDAGIKFIFGRFTMDMSLGGGIRYAYLNGHTFESTASEWYDTDYKGIVPRGNFSLGIAF